MTAPDFLVIGGMKCGSTTLYRDLAEQPSIALAEKELGALSNPGATRQSVRVAYAKAYRQARPGTLRGDVSTTYAMEPERPGVARLAGATLPSSTRIVYLVREPVARALSHHHHMSHVPGPDRIDGSIDECLRTRPEIVAYGRYANQLQAWRAEFGDDAVHVVVFERYVANRWAELSGVLRFLGIEDPIESRGLDVAHNSSDGKPVLNAFWDRVARNPAYRRWVRPLLSDDTRTAIMRRILPAAQLSPRAISKRSLDRLLATARADERELRDFLGESDPIWDLDLVRHRYAAPRRAA